MATRKTNLTSAGVSAKHKAAAAVKSTGRATASSRPPALSVAESQQRIAAQQAGTQKLAAAMPFNALKRGDHGLASGHKPQAGQSVEPADGNVGASTVQAQVQSDKLGDGTARIGHNPANESLDRVRVDSGGRPLTTNQGVPISDNPNSLKAGLRGPVLLEDFVLREKINHFDHERIPERVVHARGSAAHGYFECYEALPELTRAAPFTQAGKRTPVFVRFSTVAGERGSSDMARDVRGFAVKFYTDEGNWDLVGNNMPIFFIQDAMKFPDLVHAAKPEPHHAMPQAATAHDTFWDFAGLSPEITHMLLWIMSDRASPRSLRTMQGFGVHTFRLVNAEGSSVFVKFHWEPVTGTHSVVWDEAVKLSGADSDFHRRDLWESIETGAFPEWELALQVFTEAQADGFSFDVLDCTKLIPEELVPLRRVGKMVLNRNPDNFFAETEQVAFCTSHVVPGIDFSNDPLLQGRNFSYLDTQMSRLGGPNFHELPINAPLAQAHNHQRDGMHRQAIPRGRVNYEPNSLGGGCPYQAGMKGFVSFPAPVFEDKVRGKPEKFADHYTQASLFWNSQTPVEQKHIVAAFRFELTKVQTPAVRERVLSLLVNVDAALAQGVADGLGMPVPAAQPRAMQGSVKPEVTQSSALSLRARPGNGSVAAMHVALLVCDGVDAASLHATHAALTAEGAAPRFLGSRLGRIQAANKASDPIQVEMTLETAPSVLWDAVVLPAGAKAAQALCGNAAVLDFVKEQYRHCKPMLILGEGAQLLEAARIPMKLADGRPDPGLVSGKADPQVLKKFIAALGRRRHHEREGDSDTA